MSNKILLSFILLSLFSACTKKIETIEDPKRRFKDYISTSFSVRSVEDKKKLEAFLTGPARERFAGLEDESFKKSFVDSKRKFLKLRFREVKRLSSDQIHLTYELTYLDHGKSHEAKVTNKKLCYMKKVDGRWFIDNVKNIKLLVEYEDEMTLP